MKKIPAGYTVRKHPSEVDVRRHVWFDFLESDDKWTDRPGMRNFDFDPNFVYIQKTDPSAPDDPNTPYQRPLTVGDAVSWWGLVGAIQAFRAKNVVRVAFLGQSHQFTINVRYLKLVN